MYARPDEVRHLHTLGPHGTNLEAASHEWLSRRGIDGTVELHSSIESALEAVPDDGRHALTACAVYPTLHTLVFSNLHRLHMIDSFVMPTHRMVLASSGTPVPATVASHPAPEGLVPEHAEIREVLSNSQAARDCAEGLVEGCVTTIVAAENNGLRVLRDFGPVPMVFTVHQVLTVRPGAREPLTAGSGGAAGTSGATGLAGVTGVAR
ncbi:bacilysin biosynthesis protein BacA [Streptomyces sp. H27-H1]|uniref:bacilysin biosynthesis protein BacA n=1 Tax=Streptomyces sp. H27-H1 TaxID=2996461 RepID=UPI00226E89C2|nr:bacilysin biosynthesis protein BacA [Streptomyces sp. H27-H1]MCY0928061.1 bacilysin biosynthesis protein BacA [Streptomyces sp. H27-H1]